MLRACHQRGLMPLWLPDMNNVLPALKAPAHTCEARLGWVHCCPAGALRLTEQRYSWWARPLVGHAVPLTPGFLLGSPRFRCLHFLHIKRQLCLALPCMSNLIAPTHIPTEICRCVLTKFYGPSCMSTGTQHILLFARRVLRWHERQNASIKRDWSPEAPDFLAARESILGALSCIRAKRLQGLASVRKPQPSACLTAGSKEKCACLWDCHAALVSSFHAWQPCADLPHLLQQVLMHPCTHTESVSAATITPC